MKIDLRKDRETLCKYIEQRIRDYSLYENYGPGDDDAPISLISLCFDAEQDGCVILVFDTRPDADVNGPWKSYIDDETNACEFLNWTAACKALYAEETVVVTRHDGTKVNLHNADVDDAFQTVIGDMVANLLTEMRSNGAFVPLPLAPSAFMVVSEWDGRYYWPTYERRKSIGSVKDSVARKAARSTSGKRSNGLVSLDLRRDRGELRKYIVRRVHEYPVYENVGPGEDDAPIGLITLGFYAEQGGYVNLVFDTRPTADVDGEWTLHIDMEANTFPFPNWNAAYEAIIEGKTVPVTKHDGTTCTLQESDGYDAINKVFGEMLLDVMIEMRDDGSFLALPLTSKAFMVIEEFDGRYFWPTYRTRKRAGRIAK